MTRLRLRYVQAWVDGEGRAHHYFRRRGYPRVPLPGLPGSAAFMEAYRAALDGPTLAIGVAKRSKTGSVSAAIAAYYASQEFAALAAGTKAMRRAILERFRNAHGDKPIALLPQKFLTTVILPQLKPHAARNWLKALRALIQQAMTLEMCADDPTQGIRLPRVRNAGIHTWTEAEIARFEAHYPIGTKARLAFALLLYTVQRRSDVIRIGRQHISNGHLTIRQQKTGTKLTIELHPALLEIIAADAGQHLTLLVTRGGRPYAASDLSEQFRAWCDAAGLPKHCSAHGLRKAGCRRMAEAGCSTKEIGAVSGLKTLREVERYTKAADQVLLARSAMARVRKRFGNT